MERRFTLWVREYFAICAYSGLVVFFFFFSLLSLRYLGDVNQCQLRYDGNFFFPIKNWDSFHMGG